jgi:regulatory protein spx
MITIYTSPNCASCKKVKQWFEENKIPYKEKNIFTSVLDPEELKDILRKTENGTDDIISTRSNIIKEGKVNIDDMKISELIQFIIKNPSILKRPIMVDDTKIQVGYNKYEISSFVPAARRIALNNCPHAQNCSECANSDKIKN